MLDNEVQILEVVNEGDRPVGEGVLVHPYLVAVRPPLSDVLTGGLGSTPQLRVGLPGKQAAVCDVVAVLATDAEEPLVAVELSEPGPTEAIWSPRENDASSPEAQLRAYLFGLGGAPDAGAGGPQGHPWDACAIWPGASFCAAGPTAAPTSPA